MQLIIIILLIFKFGTAIAGTEYIVSPSAPNYFTGVTIPPIEGQELYLWRKHGGCQTSNYTVEPETRVYITENDIHVFFKKGLGGNTRCASPLIPIYISLATINELNVGIYNLKTYYLAFEDTFPSPGSDYPPYGMDMQFAVFGAPAVINSTTNVGLAMLILIMLVIGFHFKEPLRNAKTQRIE